MVLAQAEWRVNVMQDPQKSNEPVATIAQEMLSFRIDDRSSLGKLKETFMNKITDLWNYHTDSPFKLIFFAVIDTQTDKKIEVTDKKNYKKPSVSYIVNHKIYIDAVVDYNGTYDQYKKESKKVALQLEKLRDGK